MRKKFILLVALVLITSFVISLFVSVLFVSNVVLSNYNFDKSKKISQLSTGLSEMALSEDGTMLKRIQFKGMVSDFIVKYVSNNISVFISLNNSLLSSKSINSIKESANISFEKLNQIIVNTWKIIFSVVIIILFICAHEAFLNKKFQELLAILVRARSDVPAINFGVKTIKTIRWP